MPASADPDRVSVTVPATTAHLQLLRLNAAGVAGGLDFGVDEVDDLKIAMEELGAVLVGLTDGGPDLTVTYWAGPTSLVVSGERASGVKGPIALGEFLPTILEAVVDRYECAGDGRVARFEFEKALRGP